MPPRRKRARSSDDASEGEESEEETVVVPTRDPDYYDEEGNCVVKVENVLFRVHRIYLFRDSEVLADMFRLPQGTLTVEGTADENAIALDDSAANLRAFLRYSFATRLETQRDLIPTADLMDVVRVGHFANKYFATSWLEWSVSVIRTFCVPGSPHLQAISSDVLGSALHLAHLTHDADLLAMICGIWKQQLEMGRLDYSAALDAAEAAGQREFMAELYYQALARRQPHYGTDPANTQFPYRGMKPIHVQRLLAVHWSLTTLGAHIASHPPNYAPPADQRVPCESHGVCNRAWNAAWRERMHAATNDEFSPADVLARLHDAEQRMRIGHQWAGGGGPPLCFDLIMRERNPFLRLRQEIRDSLETRFFGAEGFALQMPMNPA
ncbi:hypothetical protein C8R46DRAFT_1082034 [Mycena filopes]|nr:hypothetical protein C8R46DRAFT_1082034 [Mycena filopes]